MIRLLSIVFSLLALWAPESSAESIQDLLRQGNTHLSRGQLTRAESHCLQALEILPASAEAHALLGEIYNRRGNHTDAIRHFEAALALGRNDTAIFTGLAYAYRKTGDLDSAIDVYQRFAAAFPHLAEPYLGLGGLYDVKGMNTEAEQAYATYRNLKQQRTLLE